MASVFAGSALVVVGVFAAVGAISGGILGAVIGSRAPRRAIEGALLAFIGGLVARLFIYLMLSAGNHSPGANLMIGWAFLLWPGAIDTVARLFGGPVFTTPDTMMWIATAVGALTGLMSGIRLIYNWGAAGIPSFLLDITWGMAGSTNGCLLHLFNLLFGKHSGDEGTEAHRYQSGFHVPGHPTFAFTQGAVMSNLADSPGKPLYRHELTHVWQNRFAGPLYTMSYLGWMAVIFIPGLIAGAARAGVGQGIEQWCYFNNPWEAWGYKVQHNHGGGTRTSFGTMVWSDALVLGISIPFFLLFLGFFAAMVSTVWL
jgi:hypothetical protein